jgi:phosphohistidine phosphatase
MKTIIATRHAHSNFTSGNQLDIERELSEVGKQEAKTMGKSLLTKQLIPDLIISSNATRALSTAKIIAEAINYPVQQILLENDLYNAKTGKITDVLSLLPNEYKTVLFVAHNNGISEWVNQQIPRLLLDYMSPCAMAGMQLNCNNWVDIQNAKKAYLYYDFPQNYI